MSNYFDLLGNVTILINSCQTSGFSKVGAIIKYNTIQYHAFSRLVDAKPKQLWAAVKPTVSSKSSSSLITNNPLLVNVDIVNDFFASISCDCNSGIAVTVFPQILFIMKVMCSFEIISLNLICAKLNQLLLVWMLRLVGYSPNVLMSWQA